MEGTVKFYNFKKRFGFISGEDGQEYFVHMTGIKRGNKLYEGTKVKFDEEKGDKGLKAVNVEVTQQVENPYQGRERRGEDSDQQFDE